jgi:hypothetical protein
MERYSTPLEERLRLARIHKERYARDPEYRLRCINRSRIGQGLPPRHSVDEILRPDEVAQVARETARRRQRASNGRYV